MPPCRPQHGRCRPQHAKLRDLFGAVVWCVHAWGKRHALVCAGSHSCAFVRATCEGVAPDATIADKGAATAAAMALKSLSEIEAARTHTGASAHRAGQLRTSGASCKSRGPWVKVDSRMTALRKLCQMLGLSREGSMVLGFLRGVSYSVDMLGVTVFCELVVFADCLGSAPFGQTRQPAPATGPTALIGDTSPASGRVLARTWLPHV